MKNGGSIEAVEEPTDWVHPMHLVMKAKGQIHICLDPQSLNRVIRSEHFKLPTCEEILLNLLRLNILVS